MPLVTPFSFYVLLTCLFMVGCDRSELAPVSDGAPPPEQVAQNNAALFSQMGDTDWQTACLELKNSVFCNLKIVFRKNYGYEEKREFSDDHCQTQIKIKTRVFQYSTSQVMAEAGSLVMIASLRYSLALEGEISRFTSGLSLHGDNLSDCRQDVWVLKMVKTLWVAGTSFATATPDKREDYALNIFWFLILSALSSSVAWSANEGTSVTSFSSEAAHFLPTTPLLLGHNLTPTSYTLAKGQITAGSYAIGVGVTDSLTLATSPWIDVLYNMPMIDGKYLLTKKGDFRLTLDASYFKTFPYARNIYQQESTFIRLVPSQKFSELYTLHGSFGYQYFWDDTATYSLQLSPGNGDPYTTSLSTLHELRWFKHFGSLLELGVLGLNYATPYLHLGASLYGEWRGILAQLGISRSSSMGMEYAVASSGYGYWYTRQIVWHPEVQFQFYF